MQVKIVDEQHFQVLGTNFTVGASRSGYDLMFSADGISFTKLFSVGAGVNRQVTQVAAGSYYYLSGNTGEVTVNWMKDCGGSGSGGGSYVLPIASENTLGGVKIGSGITIDANGAISAQGGSGSDAFHIELSAIEPENWTREDTAALQSMADYLSGKTIEQAEGAYIIAGGAEIYRLVSLANNEAKFNSDYEVLEELLTIVLDDVTESTLTETDYAPKYFIVDSLSELEEPGEGEMAYVRTEEVQEEYFRLYIADAESAPIPEGFWGSIINTEDGGWGERDIYLADGGYKFYWDWGDTNPREWEPGEWNGATYKYRVIIDENDPANNEFHIKFPEGSPLALTNSADGSERNTATGTSYETVYIYGNPYIYENENWLPVYKVFNKSDIEAFADSAETAEAVAEMTALAAAGRAPMVFDDTNNTMMALDSFSEGKYITFESDREGITRFISLSAEKHDEDEYDSRGIKSWGHGWRSDPQYIRKYFYVDSAGTLSSDEFYIITGDQEWQRIVLLNTPDGTGEGGDNTNLGRLAFRTLYHTQNPDGEPGDLRNYYIIGGRVPVSATLEDTPEIWEGVWGMMQDEWQAETLSWTKVSGPYESQNHPVYTPNA